MVAIGPWKKTMVVVSSMVPLMMTVVPIAGMMVSM